MRSERALNQDEIDSLLRQALKTRGVQVPDQYETRIRRNNKTSTIRVVFAPPRKQSPKVNAAG